MAYIVLISGLQQGHAFVRLFRKLGVQGMGCWEIGKAWAGILIRALEPFSLQSQGLDTATPTSSKAPWEQLRVFAVLQTQTCKEKANFPYVSIL